MGSLDRSVFAGASLTFYFYRFIESAAFSYTLGIPLILKDSITQVVTNW